MLTNSEALTKLKHEAYLALKEQGLPIPHDLRVEFEGTGDHQ
jgi:D-ribose pyranose/furanose isomerase RbsD